MFVNLVFSKYAIIFLCGDSYLKLSEPQIQDLNRIILNGTCNTLRSILPILYDVLRFSISSSKLYTGSNLLR